MRKIPTSKAPCNNNPDYDLFQCIEDHYTKKRGCQFPWNMNNASSIKICENYLKDVPSLPWRHSKNIETGALRERFKLNELLLEARKDCLPPCFLEKISVEYETWALWIKATKLSLQISLGSFIISHDEESFKCDGTCIIGELGGNLGFFLGGSILLGLDIVFMGLRKITENT